MATMSMAGSDRRLNGLGETDFGDKYFADTHLFLAKNEHGITKQESAESLAREIDISKANGVDEIDAMFFTRPSQGGQESVRPACLIGLA